MKNFIKLFSILTFISIPATLTHAAADLKCMKNCQSMGYTQEICLLQCAYPNKSPSKGKSLDSKCMNNCTRMGHTSSYCQQYCTY